jgi:hypothetical protein
MFKNRPHLLYISALLALASQGWSQDQTLSVKDTGRPLYDAIKQLRERYGWLINYQDPPIEHPDDMENRKPPAVGAPQNPSLAPRHRTISITYTPPKTDAAEERRRIIDEIVGKYTAAGAGQFQAYHKWVFSHVVPTSIKRATGNVESLTSLCDVKVSMPPANRSISESVTTILSQVSKQINVPIAIGMVPPNLFLGHHYLTEAENENACDVLSGVMENVNGLRNAAGAPPVHVVWSMLYDITSKQYFFNVGPVSTPGPAPTNPQMGPYIPRTPER